MIEVLFRSFWMWKDRYMITAVQTYKGIAHHICIYEEGELVTDGRLYGNDILI